MVHLRSAQASLRPCLQARPPAGTALGLKACKFAELCAAKPDVVLELAADGSQICMTATAALEASPQDSLPQQRCDSYARVSESRVVF
jgi:hypothetical protein